MSRIILSILLSISMLSKGEEPSVKEILQKSKDAYHSLEFYKSSGVVTANINGNTIATEFVVKVIPPKSYQIIWRLKVPGINKFKQTGAVWNSDNQPFLYMNMNNSYARFDSDYMALSAATGISNGAAFTIPSLILKAFENHTSQFSQLQNPKLIKKETLFNDECFLISGFTKSSKEVSYWISTDLFLVRKIKRSYENGKSVNRLQKDFSKEEISEMLKKLGQEINEKNIKGMKDILDKSSNLKDSTIKGYSEEIHSYISLEPLTKSGLEYKLPRDAIQKQSLFENMFDKVPKHNHTHKQQNNE